jgi:hypothetical protein
MKSNNYRAYRLRAFAHASRKQVLEAMARAATEHNCIIGPVEAPEEPVNISPEKLDLWIDISGGRLPTPTNLVDVVIGLSTELSVEKDDSFDGSLAWQNRIMRMLLEQLVDAHDRHRAPYTTSPADKVGELRELQGRIKGGQDLAAAVVAVKEFLKETGRET